MACLLKSCHLQLGCLTARHLLFLSALMADLTSSLRTLAVAVKFLKGECGKGGRHPTLHRGGKSKCLRKHMQTKHLNEVTQWGPRWTVLHMLYAKETAALQLRLMAAQTFTLFWEARNLCFNHNNQFKSLTLREPNKTCLWADCQFEISDLDLSDFQPSLSTSVIDQGYVFFFYVHSIWLVL